MKNFKTFYAFDAKDTEEIRLEKFTAFLVAFSCSMAGIVWTATYYYVFGWGITTALPASFVIIVGTALLISHLSKNLHYAIYAQIICIIYIPTFIQWTTGGVFDSGFVMFWAFIGPMCALMFFSIKQSMIWLGLYLINLLITIIFNNYFASNSLVVTENIKLIFFLMNLSAASIVVFIFSSYYVKSAIKEKGKANKLLEANLQQEITLRQSEKLATLGKLSAGVAHELNNPAAATQRGAEQLVEVIKKLETVEFNLGQANFSKSQMEELKSHITLIEQRAQQPIELNPLTRSDKEYEIETWLNKKGIEDAWEMAPMLVNIGYDNTTLTDLENKFPSNQFQIVILLFCSIYLSRNLLEEISKGTNRITEIVKAMRSYSYLDQAPVQSVDIHEGLDDTLIMLRSKLKRGIKVEREYAKNLPSIQAYGSELNQVWTNIIDNAVSAMDGQGEIFLKTYQKDSWVIVEIKDSGPGIPPKIISKIFDPFFTTKPPGQGTGLGLNISHSIIVQKHKGEITVHSEPGETCFEVKLPLILEEKKQNNSK
jgi:signal transduction histidine kinase